MPSMAHEILVDLFKNRPSLAAEILIEVLGVSLPPYAQARLASTDLNEIQPAEYRRSLEAMMKGYEYQSDFARKYVAEGLAEGLAKGRAEGRAEEAARALLTVLRARGIAVPDAVRERILAQKEPERLERWLERAAVATSVAEVIDESN